MKLDELKTYLTLYFLNGDYDNNRTYFDVKECEQEDFG